MSEFMMMFLFIGVCISSGVGGAFVLGRIFGGTTTRETYLPSKPVGNERRYW